jgi:Fic family protein
MEVEKFKNSPSGKMVKTPQDYWAFVPNPLPPSIKFTPKLVRVLSDADRTLGELAGIGRTLPNPHLLIRPFVRREAVLSSRIEGTQASLSDLFYFEAARKEREAGSDVREVLNYVRALEYGLKRLKTLPMSLRLIRELHARLMKGVRGSYHTPGEFRRSQNWIGSPGCMLNEATFVPPPIPEMKEALDAFEKYLHKSSSLPPLVNLALIHYQFEAIHPFLDGNGRIGRLLITLLLCQWELLPQPLLYLSAFFEKYRDVYYDLLLAVSQEGCWEEWIAFFLSGIKLQSIDAVLRIRRLQRLHQRYRKRFQEARSSALILNLIDFLFESPILTVRRTQKRLKVTFRSAQQNIDKLIQAGILKEITGRSRNRIFLASEILKAIEKPLVKEERIKF